MSETSDQTNEIDTLARTIWGEARGEGYTGMAAVANVIVNRANNPRWWGHDIVTVCLKPEQFSCWNVDDPNFKKLLAVGDDDQQFTQALLLAEAAVNGNLGDATNGADSYVDLRYATPEWAVNSVSCAKIGNHTFYRLELAAPVAPDAGQAASD